jgi:hypothetical protein
MDSTSHKDGSSDNDRVLPPLDLNPLLNYAQAAISQVLGPLLASSSESAQIMRKHILRSEAELLRGLLAVVEKEQQKAESAAPARDRTPQRVTVE